MRRRYGTVRVHDLDIHYELADYPPPWRETPPQTFLLYHGYALRPRHQPARARALRGGNPPVCRRLQLK